MRVRHTLWIPRCARCVAVHHGAPLVENRPLGHRLDISDEVLVGDRPWYPRPLCGWSHDDNLLDCCERGDHRCEERCEVRVDEDHLVFSVVDDIGQLFREQPDVERVTDASAVCRRPIELMMTMIVPRKGADGIPHLGPELLLKCGGEFPDTDVCLGICRTMNRSVRFDGDDLLIGVLPYGVVVQGAQQQRKIVLHVHGGPFTESPH